MGTADSDPLQRWLDDGGSPSTVDLRLLRPQADSVGPLQLLIANARALVESLSELAAAEFDLARLRVRNLVLRCVLIVAAGIVAVLTFAASVVILLVGIAQGLGQALGGRVWLGYLLTGALGVVFIAGFIWLLEARARRTSLNKQKAKYEHDR